MNTQQKFGGNSIDLRLSIIKKLVKRKESYQLLLQVKQLALSLFQQTLYFRIH